MQDLILDHYQHPRNHRLVDGATLTRRGANPLCGDEVAVSLRIEADTERIDDIGCTSRGCSMVQASASMMTELVMNRGCTDALSYLQWLASSPVERSRTRGGTPPAPDEPTARAQLDALRGMRMLYPARAKCALLPWTTLKQAIEQYRAPG